MINLTKKWKVWRRSGRSTERCLGEWQKFFVEERQERGASLRNRNQIWWMEEVAKAVGEKER